ncbi:uncharacterized protein LOC142339930 [Convolutriloba macropyga]|uniref:uncharacterized protein LOC142339930 n=1 Tax=Convolutriloba macropyga TaxID=536237 RepID=UPI003F523D4A
MGGTQEQKQKEVEQEKNSKATSSCQIKWEEPEPKQKVSPHQVDDSEWPSCHAKDSHWEEPEQLTVSGPVYYKHESSYRTVRGLPSGNRNIEQGSRLEIRDAKGRHIEKRFMEQVHNETAS